MAVSLMFFIYIIINKSQRDVHSYRKSSQENLVCVYDGRFEKLHLALVGLIVLWGRVRLHTCFT